MEHSQLIQIGMFFVFVGIIIILSSIFFIPTEGKSNVKFSVFGLIGPIPFGFGNDKKLFLVSLAIFVLIAIISLLYVYRTIR